MKEVKSQKTRHVKAEIDIAETEIEEEFCAIMESIKSEDTKICDNKPTLVTVARSSDDVPLRCRLCATLNNNMVDIFRSTESTEDISRMIKHSLPIVVAETDSLPKQVCRRCLEKLELCFQFQESVAEAEKLLLAFDGEAPIKREQMVKNHHTCSPRSESRSILKHDIERTLVTVLDEGIDDNQSATTVPEKQTADTNLESKSILTSLKPCSVTLVRTTTYCRDNPHENGEGNSINDKKQNPDVPMDILNTGGASASRIDIQSLCESSVSVRTRRGSEADEQGSLSTYCEEKCENSGSLAAPREAHPMKTHSKRESAVKTFNTDGHSKNGDNRCSLCNKAFSSQSAVNFHMIVHSGEKPWICDYCKKGFGRKDTLRRHLSGCKLRLDISQRSHKCDLCIESFQSKRGLIRHYRLHTGGRLHKCEYCQKNFSCRSERNRHHRGHKNERPYECAICPKKFKYSSSLRRHVIRHSNLKNQIRLLCGESSEMTLLKSNK